jgi:excisionase family DNA binding protein
VVDLGVEYVGVREAARLLGVHENTVRAWVDSGLLGARRLPGSGFRRVSVASIQRVLDADAEGAAGRDG